MAIRFNMNEEKAIAVLAWLANKQPGIDAFYVSKVLYFADKEHLNRFGRPILGDQYIRMEFGPVPSQTYDLIKKTSANKIALKKLREYVEVRRGEYRYLLPLQPPNMDLFSKTDIECLTNALNKCSTHAFGKLSDLTHTHAAWKKAPKNRPMNYEDMLEPSPKRKKIIQNLKEHSHQIVF